MNTQARAAVSPLVTDTARQSTKGGFHQTQVLRAFSRMQKGQLHIELPDGSRLHLGTPQTPAQPPLAPAAATIPAVATLRVLHSDFFRRCVLFGDIGFAEAYLDGLWETNDLRAVIAWFILNLDQAPTLSGSSARSLGLNLLRAANRLGHLLRPNSRLKASRNIREHYDLSNDFFRLWLDPSMMYSSARWSSPALSLEEAQAEKNEQLCRKLRLQASDHVLEIGTGWGGWSLHAASRHGCRVTSLTISPEQCRLARERIAAAGLSERIEVRLLDYRELPADERFDKLVSIEMLEAVGHRYLPDWCRSVSRALKPEGLLALQFITCPDSRYKQFRQGVDFIQKHIFPGSLLLSLNRLNQELSSQGGFILHSLEDLGQDYAQTLRLWQQRYHEQCDALSALGFDARFHRKWSYYLSYCEAAFALRNISVVQTLHTRPNNLSFA